MQIENIDIGGPSMLRAAAKNWQDVAVITDAADYDKVLEELRAGGVSKETKFYLAAKVFETTAAYDALISSYLRKKTGNDLPKSSRLPMKRHRKCRYGENPHQRAAFYRTPLPVEGSLAIAEQLNGKELSYNNINDANGALELVKEFDEPCVVAQQARQSLRRGRGREYLRGVYQGI